MLTYDIDRLEAMALVNLTMKQICRIELIGYHIHVKDTKNINAWSSFVIIIRITSLMTEIQFVWAHCSCTVN